MGGDHRPLCGFELACDRSDCSEPCYRTMQTPPHPLERRACTLSSSLSLNSRNHARTLAQQLESARAYGEPSETLSPLSLQYPRPQQPQHPASQIPWQSAPLYASPMGSLFSYGRVSAVTMQAGLHYHPDMRRSTDA